jgi:L-malate glycosyltransferase
MSNESLKVGYLLGSLNRGGTETLLLDIFHNASQAPFRMICIYRKVGELTEDFLTSGVPVYKISPGKAWMIWLYLFRLNRQVRKCNLDILHVNQSVDSIYARLACLGLSVKIIQTTHEFDRTYSRKSRFLKRLSFTMADKNLFVSHVLLKHFKSGYKLNQNEISVLYNSVDFKKFGKIPAALLRKQMGIDIDTLILGMVGNFTPGHDQETICRFLALLDQQKVKFIFLFVGSKDLSHPQLYDECVQFCQKNNLDKKIIFMGSRPDVPQLLPQFDAFIYSSVHDAFGIAVVEAIAAGIPVFVNDWDVMEEITENGKRAYLYRSKDENDLLKKFMHFYSEPECYREKATMNAEWARNNFNIENYLGKLSQEYSLL